MNFVRLNCFLAVAKHGSVTDAANTLFMTEPSVSFQITQLEKELGTSLFERSYHHLELTLTGQIFRKTAKTILDTYRDGLLNIYQSKTPIKTTNEPLKIETYVAPDLKVIQHQIMRFSHFFPQISVDVNFNPLAETLANLRLKSCDLAIGIMDDSPDLNWIPILKDRYVLAYSTSLHRQSLKLSDLANMTEIEHQFEGNSYFGKISQRLHNKLPDTSPKITTDSLNTLLLKLSISSTPSYAVLPSRIIDQHTFDLSCCAIPSVPQQQAVMTIGWAYLKDNDSELIQLFQNYYNLTNNL